MDINYVKDILGKLSIHVIPYCHADHSWLHPRQWHVKRYLQVIDEVLDLLESNPDYTFMLDNLNHMVIPYIRTPRSQELIDMINTGRLEMTGPVKSLIRPTRAGGEAFIRNVQHAREFLSVLGVKKFSYTYHNVDVSAGHPQLPQILNLLGFKYYRCWRPQGAMDAKGIPRQFIWRSPDNSSILCSRGTYAGIWKTDYLNTDEFFEEDGKLEKFFSNELEEMISLNSTGVIWLPFGMDDTRPLRDVHDNPINMDGLMKHMSDSSDTDISYSNSDAYFNQLSKHPLPEHAGSLDPCEVSYNIPTKGDRGLWVFRPILEKLLLRIEIICAQHNPDNYPYDRIHRLWDELLYISGHAMEFALKEDYEEIYQRAEFALKNATELLYTAANRMTSCDESVDGFTLVNPLPYLRKGIFIIPSGEVKSNDGDILDSSCKKYEYQIFRDIHTGKDQYAVNMETGLEGFATRYLSFGSKVSSKSPATNTKSSFVDTGMITSKFHKGSLYSINGCTSAVDVIGNLYFMEIEETSDDAWLHNYKHGEKYCFLPEDWEFVDTGPLVWRYRVSGVIGNFKACIYYTFYKNESRLDFDITIDSGIVSNGFFAISFPVDKSCDMTGGIPFGHEKKDIRNEIYGKATSIDIDNLERMWPGLFYFNDWLLFDSFAGSSLILSKKLSPYAWYEANENRLSILLTRTFNLMGCTDWMKYTHPFNECIGTFNFNFSMLFNESGFDFTRTAVESSMTDHPVIVFRGKPEDNTKSLFSIKSDHCILSALYMESDGHIIRVYNTSFNTDNLQINSIKPIQSCFLTNLNKSIIDNRDMNIDKRGLSVKVTVRPCEILTLYIKLK